MPNTRDTPANDAADGAASTRAKPVPLDGRGPRSLSPTQRTLLARHRSATEATSKTFTSKQGENGTTFRLGSADGAVEYVVWLSAGPLHVSRTQRRPLGTHCVQSVALANRHEFDAWCDADAVRFEYPLLYERLRALRDEHFGIE